MYVICAVDNKVVSTKRTSHNLKIFYENAYKFVTTFCVYCASKPFGQKCIDQKLNIKNLSQD